MNLLSYTLSCTNGTHTNEISIKIAFMQQNEIQKKLGKNIKKFRKKRKISLNLLAYENDINKSTLSRVENGLVDPKLTTVYKIAQSLDVTIDDLLK